MQQVQRAGDVGVDDVAHVVEVLIEKAFSQPSAGIGEQRIDRAPSHGGINLIDTLQGRQIRLDRIDIGAKLAELLRRLVDGRLVGGDDQIEPVSGAFLGQFDIRCR